MVMDIHDHILGFSPNKREDVSNIPIHNMAFKYLSDGYTVIYAAESTTPTPTSRTSNSSHIAAELGWYGATGKREEAHYKQQRPEDILNNFASHLRSDKIKRYFQKGLFAIIDPNIILPANAGTKELLDSMIRYVESYEPKLPYSAKIKGKVLVNAPDNFFEANEFDKFLKFEHLVGTKFDDNFTMICWYRKKWVQNLSFSQLMHLFTSHHRTVHRNAQFQMLNADRIMQVMGKAIDRAVEQDNASTIILEVMQRRFNLTAPEIISSPDLFINVLKKMSPDPASAEAIINTLTAEFKTKLDFNDSSDKSWRSSRITGGNPGTSHLQKKTRKLRRSGSGSTSKGNTSAEDNKE
jgi:hypothetical protein